MELLAMAGLGAVLFVISLVINAVAGRILHVDVSRTMPSVMPASMWFVGLFGTAALAGLGAWWYFSSHSAGILEGLILGLVLVAVGIVLDAAFILPLKNGRRMLLGYFAQWQYWLTVSTLVGVCVTVGALS